MIITTNLSLGEWPTVFIDPNVKHRHSQSHYPSLPHRGDQRW